MSAVLEARSRRSSRVGGLNLYLVQAPYRPAVLPAQDGVPTFQSAVVAAPTRAAAKELAQGVSDRNQWLWPDDEISVKRLAAGSNARKPRVFSAAFDLN